MRSTVIRADFDGKRRVWAPVGGFFGSGPGLNSFKGWWRQVEQDGWMTCWWPMPFRESARVSVINHGASEPVDVEFDDIGVAAWEWTDPIIAAWEGGNQRPAPYDAGSAGPEEALALLHRDGRRWREVRP